MKSNFLKRSITGLCFVVILIGSILWSPVSFAAVFAAITLLAVSEFCTLINRSELAHVNHLVNMLGGVALFLAFTGFCMGLAGSEIFIPYLLIVVYLFVSELYRKHKTPLQNWAFSTLSQMYVALPFALLNVLAFQNNPTSGEVSYNAILPLSVFVFVWLSDSGAYCVGSLIGKHRLFERISPKKSWEGSIGGGVVAIASSFLFAYYFPFLSVWQWAGLALVVVVFGTLGDLSESLMKRQLGIKDSGTMLPGHGGVLDRFDSALVGIPAGVVYLFVVG